MLRAFRLVILAGLLLQAAGVSAAGFSVSPIRVELSKARPMAAISVTNAGETDVVVQSELLRWKQVNGNDAYEATGSLIVNPPIFRIKPKSTQVIRVGLREPADPAKEITYRLYLAEVPAATKSDAQGLRLALRVGLPVFVLPEVKAAPTMIWKATRTAADSMALELRNSGNAHVQIKDVKLGADDSKIISEKTFATYVLSGESKQWKFTVDPKWTGTTLHLSARTDADDVDMDLQVQAR